MAILTISIVDPNDDDFTTASPHLLSNGDAIRLSATTAPGGTVNGTVYYARVISETIFAIHATRANAKNNINQIAISSQGTDVTFLIGDPQERTFEFSRVVNHPGSEPIASVFSDYSRELVFVENVSTEYSRLDVLHSTGGKPVFGKGITTSPTYIFTDDAPKAAPTAAQIKEYWYLT
jgi:hypothetical protein